jgi:fructose-bisphosphate aldolase class I
MGERIGGEHPMRDTGVNMIDDTESTTTSRRRHIVRLGLFAAFLLGLWTLVAVTRVIDVDDIRRTVAATGPLTPVTYVVVSAFLGAIFVPGTILAAGSGVLFGPALGTLVTLCSAVGTATIASLAGRRAGRDSARALLGADRADRIDAQIQRRGLWAVVGQRFIPGISDALASYTFGAFGVPVWQMAVGSFIGSAPRAFVYTALGASITNLKSPLAYTAIAVWCVTAVIGAFAAQHGLRHWRRRDRNQTSPKQSTEITNPIGDNQMANADQTEKMRSGKGVIAALDQSGGSTPKALKLYGIEPSAYSTDEQMFDLMHQMRSRIITSPVFGGDRILAAILFEQTMDLEIEGTPSATYLWQDKGVVPFLKIDKGLADAADDVELMKPIPGLDDLLERAVTKGIFGTKERSVIGGANRAGIAAIVAQQFEVGHTVLSHGLVPILEPEVTITIDDKAAAEDILLEQIVQHLGSVPDGQQVMVKVSLPTVTDHYRPLIEHPKVLRVAALSGGYSRDEADALLAQNRGLIASFSRALTEGLSAEQSDDEFNATLDRAIQAIYDASVT